MLRTEFTTNSPGRLARNLDGNLAFVPAPLPPAIQWTNSLVKSISNANQKLGLLIGLGRNIRNPQRLVRMFLRREAELSSQIENTFARVQTMLLFEQNPAVEGDTPSVREVHNNFLALEYALQSAPQRGLTRSLIKKMQEILMRDVRGGDKMPGRFRPMQAHIGRSADIHKARFVPCPPLEIENCMQGLESYLAAEDDCPPIARVAMAHYQFEAIHPFADGNGRVGRALLLVQLLRECGLPAALLNPSAQLELHRREYYDLLLEVSQQGHWGQWIEFFADCIGQEALEAVSRVERLEALRLEYYKRVSARRASVLLLKMIDELFSQPSTTVANAAVILGISPRGAGKLLERLEDARIIREVTGGARNRVYLAQEIVDLFALEKNV